MGIKTAFGVGTALVLAIAGCVSAELSLSSYSESMQEVEAQFLEASLDHGSPDGAEYPIGDELVYFTHAFDILESRVDGWKAIEPPQDLVGEHANLVATMEEVQRIVLDYAQHAALKSDDFAIDQLTVDAKVIASSAEWRAACRNLAERAILLDAPIAFAGSCAVPTLTG